MIHIKALPLRSTRLSVSLAAALSMGALPSCDSLWNGFTADVPNSCAAPMSQHPCTGQQVCNPTTGACVTPLQYSNITPNTMPASGGGTVDVAGLGFTSDTVFNIAGQPLLNPSVMSGGTIIHGTVPRSPNRCGLVDISMSRADGAKVQKDAQFRYILEPLSFHPTQTAVGVYDLITHFLTANMDGDSAGRPDLVFGHAAGFSVLFNSDLAQPNIVTTKIPAGIGERIAIARVNGNPFPDVIVSNKLSGQLEVYSNNGSSTGYSPASSVSVNGSIKDIAPVDIDDNGTDELVLNTSTGVGASTVALYSRSVTSNKFVFSADVPIAADLGGMALGDFDGNGAQDVAIAGFDKSWRLLTIDRSGKSVKVTNTTGNGFIMGGMVSGDWDNDGKTDLAMINSTTGRIYIFNLSNGSTPVSSVDIANTGTIPGQSMQAFDINCDGLLDIIVNRPGTQPGELVFVINTGQSTFRPGPSINTTKYQGGPFLVVDYKSDTLPEIFGRGGTLTQNSFLAVQELIVP